MHTTHHHKARHAQRVIPLKLVDYVLTHGAEENDKFVLGIKEAKLRLADLELEKRLQMKIADKGEVVVAEGDALIMTSNFTHRD